MRDAHDRKIEYLRLSVTEKCNLKCAYCSPEGTGPYHDFLSTYDIERVVRACVNLGINKVRITGGEPLMRRDIEEIISGIAAIKGISDLSMTTNAQGLRKRVQSIKDAGLKRINISIASLKPERYKRITGGGEIAEVLKGIELSVHCGLDPVKLNTVIIRGENDDEVDDFIKLAKDMPIEVRFIELMPFSGLGRDQTKIVYNKGLIEQRGYLKKIASDYDGQPAENYQIEGYAGKIGFISPMSHKFCNTCNRIRITSDGLLKPCLGNNREADLKEALRYGDDKLLEVLKKGIYEKPEGHNFEQGFDSKRNMNRIGG